MARYRWVGSHAYRDHAKDRTVAPGEEIPEDAAERIATAHPHDVEEIDEGSDADDSDDESENDVAGFETITDFVERTPVEDVADDILEGNVDDHLDVIPSADDRQTVHDAVEERRNELEDGE